MPMQERERCRKGRCMILFLKDAIPVQQVSVSKVNALRHTKKDEENSKRRWQQPIFIMSQ